MVRLEGAINSIQLKLKDGFNSTMVRLEGISLLTFSNFSSSFQFHDGAIRRIAYAAGAAFDTSFNSTMVRLEVACSYSLNP